MTDDRPVGILPSDVREGDVAEKARIIHRLNNLLGGVIALSEILTDHQDPAVAQLAEDIISRVEQAAVVVEDMRGQ